jgi:hypothetical protein
MKYLFSVLLTLLYMPVLQAQVVPDSAFNPRIKAIKLFAGGNQLSYPILPLGTIGGLELDFDELDASQVNNYYYTFVLCNEDWSPANLNVFDYIKGFTQQRISTYRVSSIAKQPYIHYQASLPDRNCAPSRSGNYLLKVYTNGDTAQLAFTRRLLVVDNIVPIGARIMQPFNTQASLTSQKVQFSIDKGKLDILNIRDQLKVVVLQNYRWDNAVRGAQPLFMRDKIFEYNGERDFIFPAGKEFRWADLRSFRYQSERVAGIDRTRQPYEVYLKEDADRSNLRYIFFSDLNGNFEITSTDENGWWQADFANVHFTLVPGNNQPYPDKDVYLAGQFTDYKLNDDTKMAYNAAKGVYEKTIYLKQGYYSYTYLTRVTQGRYTYGDVSQTEGNSWETENDYTVLVYYRSLGGRHDELVGAVTINSRNGTGN